MTHDETPPPVLLGINIFPHGRTFDCCDCGDAMERVAYHHEIRGGIRFICETCRPNYVTPSFEEVRGEISH